MGMVSRFIDGVQVLRRRRKVAKQWRQLGPYGQIAAMATLFEQSPPLRKQFRRALRAQSNERDK